MRKRLVGEGNVELRRPGHWAKRVAEILYHGEVRRRDAHPGQGRHDMDQMRLVAGADLGLNAAAVLLDSFVADGKLGRDPARAEALAKPAGNLDLARRQAVRVAVRTLRALPLMIERDIENRHVQIPD